MRLKEKAKVFAGGMIAAALLLGTGFGIRMLTEPAHVTPVYAAPASRIVSLPDFSGIAHMLNPTVVTIESVSTFKHPNVAPFGGNDDFFRFFFGPNFRNQMPQQEQKQVSWGSGVIVSSDGYIITNNHVVKNADKVKVTLENDDTKYDAKIIGTDPEIDIALLKINKKNLPTAKLGDSAALKVGEWVVAIGNPLGYSHSVTAGIVSGKGRRLSTGMESFIQTDAAINFGNSGGPLVNMSGEVVGINTAISAQGQNIGFAVPINMVKDVFQQLKETGKVERGALGVTVSKLSETDKRYFKVDHGALIQTVQKGMAADKAGLKPYDIIVALNGKPVKNNDELVHLVASHRPGDKVKVTVSRNGKTKTFGVTLSSRDDFTGNTPAGRDKKAPENKSLSGKLGFNVMPLTDRLRYQLRLGPSINGVVVVDVDQMSEAYDKFIREGSVILEMDRQPVTDYDTFLKRVQKLRKGDVIMLKLYDRGNFRIVTLDVQ
ncbi:MAG: Do family serine endopeptidase [Acidobacteria bacterium]|nr:Do family serine endopeptidase [Acidobacteriota bacterium]